MTYDNAKEDVFIVHLHDKEVRFAKMGNNLYVYKPNKHKSSNMIKPASMVTTMEENKAFFTQHQFERAKRARDLYHAIGTPSVQDFKVIIQMNAITNNPVTTKDIEIAGKIVGPDVSTLKRKTTRQKPAPVVHNYIEIPQELLDTQRDVILCADGMKVNGLPFLTTVSRNLMYRTAQWISSQTLDVYKQAFGQVIAIYNRGGFKIRCIHVDNEFRPLMDSLNMQYNVEMNFTNPQEHVPEAERNNRVIKERVRALYHRLPFQRLPRILIRAMVQEAAKKLNFFPAKHGVSEYYSPRMILHQRNFDYNRHCQYSLGAYVQAHNEPDPSNTNAPHTLDCIYLRYNDNAQGGHECLHLQSNRIVLRRCITPIPITPSVIARVHALADQDGIPEGLKIQNRLGTILYDSAWIAGVDYDDERFNDDDYVDSDNEDNSVSVSDDEYEYDEMDPDEIAALEEASVDELNDEIADNPNDDDDNNTPSSDESSEKSADDSDDDDSDDDDPDNENIDGEEHEAEAIGHITRSGRVSRMPKSYDDFQMHLHTQSYPPEEYSQENVMVIATIMCQMNYKLHDNTNESSGQFVQSTAWQRNKEI